MPKLIPSILLTLALTPVAWAQSPQVVARSQFITAGEIHTVETLDGTRVYRLTVELGSQKPPAGATVEYEILNAAGSALGGGMFTVDPEMLSTDGASVTVLTGFGGLDLGSGHTIVVKLREPDLTPAKRPADMKRAVEESGITDTCTYFCDRCSEKAGTLCNLGVQTYNCSCDNDSRTCHFTCYKGV